jgi:hypothetical protein
MASTAMGSKPQQKISRQKYHRHRQDVLWFTNKQ